jgi:ParB/RepB/Spo0J family partition protein
MNDPNRKPIPIQQIHAAPSLLRHLKTNTVEYEELKQAIREHGVLMNVVVRETAPNEYEIIEGMHRWAAAREVGLTELPCLVRDADVGGVMGLQVVGNAVRVETTPLEYAHQLARIIEHYRSGGLELTVAELAGMVCKKREWVRDRLNLLKLSEKWQKALDAGEVKLGHALVIVRLSQSDQNIWLRDARKLKFREFEYHVKRWMAQKRAESLNEVEKDRYGQYTPHVRNLSQIVSEIQDKSVAQHLRMRYNIIDPLVMAEKILEWVVHLDEESRQETEAQHTEILTRADLRDILVDRRYEEFQRIEDQKRDLDKRKQEKRTHVERNRKERDRNRSSDSQ